MARLVKGTIGISPPSALGVAFFFHLTRQLRDAPGPLVFLERSGSSSTAAIRAAGFLTIATGGEKISVPVVDLFPGDLCDAYHANRLPEIVLIAANPDQLLDYISGFVALLERQYADGELLLGADGVPRFILCANGLYFQRVRQLLIEKIEEAVLLGRLPELWPDLMPGLVGRWMRGVTFQTALREGDGARAIYRPGPRNLTTLAGGDAAGRAKVCARLTELGGWFEDAHATTPTTLEFQKAFVNLNSNLLGLIHAIDEQGRFRLLRLHEIYTAEFRGEATELVAVVLRIGQAVRAFSPSDQAEPLVEKLYSIAQVVPGHVPSSLQWVDQQLRLGRLRAEVPPTETWLLNPLLHYAKSSGLACEVAYLEALKNRLIARMTLACEAQPYGRSQDSGDRSQEKETRH